MADLDKERSARYFDLVLPGDDYWRNLTNEPSSDSGRYHFPTNVSSAA